MKKNIIILLLLTVVLVGCTPSSLNKVYKNMTSDKTNGYVMNLSVYGKIDESRYGKEIRYQIYQDEQVFISEKVVTSPTDYYYQDYILESGKTLVKESGQFIETKGPFKDEDYEIYLDGLKNIKKVNSKSKELIKGEENVLYEVTFETKFFNKILSSLDIPNIDNEEVVKGRIHYKNDYPTRISYVLDEFSIILEYSSINKTEKVKY